MPVKRTYPRTQNILLFLQFFGDAAMAFCGLLSGYWVRFHGPLAHLGSIPQAPALREYLPLGQRIEAFALDAWKAGQWVEFAHGTSIGNHRLLRSEPVTTDKVRLRITQSPVCPALTEFGLYAEAPAGH